MNMKKISTLSFLVFIIFIYSCKKDENDKPDNHDQHYYIEYYNGDTPFYSLESFTKMHYVDGKFNFAEIGGHDTINFTYENGKLDSFVGSLFGCCDYKRYKKYHYFNDSLIDYISFSKTSTKDDGLEHIDLDYDNMNRINFYRMYHSLDPTDIFFYEWEGDDIDKVTVYSYSDHYSPDSVISSINYYTYTDEENPLKSLNTLYFRNKFLNKHLAKDMTQIRYNYTYDISQEPIIQTLASIDTLHYTFYYEYNDEGLVKNIFRNNKLTDVIKYIKQ